MADALESTGDEAQHRVALMGRRLTSLRVKEIELNRTAAAQQTELRGLRAERHELRTELLQSRVEAAAEQARLERSQRELRWQLDRTQEEQKAMAPLADLENERNAKERFMSAYHSLAEQSARTAGAASDAARFESEKTFVQKKLELTEAALAAATQTSEEKVTAFMKMADVLLDVAIGKGQLVAD